MNVESNDTEYALHRQMPQLRNIFIGTKLPIALCPSNMGRESRQRVAWKFGTSTIGDVHACSMSPILTKVAYNMGIIEHGIRIEETHTYPDFGIIWHKYELT